MTAGNRVLFAKLRPQNADIAKLCRELRRVFVGYPAWKLDAPSGVRPTPHHLIDVVSHEGRIDASELSSSIDNRHNYARQVNKQRTRILEVARGSYVLIPRLGEGIVYVAEILSGFQIFDAAPWADRYLADRRNARLNYENEQSHIGDVMQGWDTDDWVALPFTAIPRWISQGAMARDTMGLVKNSEEGRSAWSVVHALRSNRGAMTRVPTGAPGEIVGRMHDLLSPDSFEHLCVDPMQLEHPGEIWTHVGGSGDGGADGLGYSSDGQVAAVLQCKYQWPGEVSDPRRGATGNAARSRLILASLVHGRKRPQNLPEDAVWLGASEVANLVLKHRKRLPIAMTLAIEGAS